MIFRSGLSFASVLMTCRKQLQSFNCRDCCKGIAICEKNGLKSAAKSTQRATALVLLSLQKRLLSSIDAFARTLKVHQTAIAKQVSQTSSTPVSKGKSTQPFSLLLEAAGADDDRAELAEDEVEAEENAQMKAATEQDASIPSARELELLKSMAEIANAARHLPDPRIQQLMQWIRDNQCPGLGTIGAKWNDRRVIIFTEYTDTKRYLQQQLQAIIAGSDQEQHRVGVFHGGMGDDRREEIKLAFNSDPAKHPLRVLIATDAAREGINLQNHCADLFHFDLPLIRPGWNSGTGGLTANFSDRPLCGVTTLCCPSGLKIGYWMCWSKKPRLSKGSWAVYRPCWSGMSRGSWQTAFDMKKPRS
jgi:hypothetical protein